MPCAGMPPGRRRRHLRLAAAQLAGQRDALARELLGPAGETADVDRRPGADHDHRAARGVERGRLEADRLSDVLRGVKAGVRHSGAIVPRPRLDHDATARLASLQDARARGAGAGRRHGAGSVAGAAAPLRARPGRPRCARRSSAWPATARSAPC